MLRTALLWASTNPRLARTLPRYPFVRRAVRRFMPGETADDALREAERLRDAGAAAVVTCLGENVADAGEAAAVAAHYVDVMERVRSRGLDVEVAAKPTQLGLDSGEAVAEANVRRLAAAAGELGCGTLWLDMEGSDYTDRTLALYRRLRSDGLDVGVALQSYLYRTDDDIEALLPLRPTVRLVKGAYREPPAIAHPKKAAVDAAFQRHATRLLRAAAAGETGRVAIATHDERMIAHARSRAHELELPPERWEVEMLYGIGTELQRRLLHGSIPLRILISYGDAWFPWYMRRLAERPANLWFVARQLVRS